MGGISGVFGVSGLTGGGTVSTVELSIDAPIAPSYGGTGANTVAAARGQLFTVLGSNAVGDMYYRNTVGPPGTLQRIQLGTPGQILTVNAGGTAPIWQTSTGSGPGGGGIENPLTDDIYASGHNIIGIAQLSSQTIQLTNYSQTGLLTVNSSGQLTWNGAPVGSDGGMANPWTENVDAGQNVLHNLAALQLGSTISTRASSGELLITFESDVNSWGIGTVGSTGYAPMQGAFWMGNSTTQNIAIFVSPPPNLYVSMGQQSGGGVNLTPNFALDVTGDINCTGVYRRNGIEVSDGMTAGVANPMTADLCADGYSIDEVGLLSLEYLLLYNDNYTSQIAIDASGNITVPNSLDVTGEANGYYINGVAFATASSARIGAHDLSNVASINGIPVSSLGEGAAQTPWIDDIEADGFSLYQVNQLACHKMLLCPPAGGDTCGFYQDDNETVQLTKRLKVGGTVNATGYLVGGIPLIASSGSRAGAGHTLLNIEEIAFTGATGAGPGMTIDGYVNVTDGYYLKGEPFTGGDGDGFAAVWPADVNAGGHNLAGIYKLSAYSVENVHTLWIDANPDTRVGTRIDRGGIHWRDVASHPDVWAFERNGGDGDIYLYYTTPPVAGPPQTRVCMIAHSTGLIEFPSGFLTEHIGMHDNSGQAADIGPGWLSLNYSANDRINMGPDYLVMTLNEASPDRLYLGIWPEADGTLVIRNGYGYNDHDTMIDPDGTLHVANNLVVRGESTGDDVIISFMKSDRGFKLDYNNYLGELAMYDPDGFSPLRMRNGNVAIGYDSYGYSSKLSVNGNVNVLGAMGINCQSPAAELELRAAQYGSTFPGATLRFGSGIGSGDIKIGGIDFVSQSTVFASIQAYTGNSSYIGRIIIYTGGTERIRLDESGDVRITGRLFVNGVQVNP